MARDRERDRLLRKALDDETAGGIEVARFLVRVMRGDEPELVGSPQMVAALEINNRLFGRSKERVEVTASGDPELDGLSDEDLRRIVEGFKRTGDVVTTVIADRAVATRAQWDRALPASVATAPPEAGQCSLSHATFGWRCSRETWHEPPHRSADGMEWTDAGARGVDRG